MATNFFSQLRRKIWPSKNKSTTTPQSTILVQQNIRREAPTQKERISAADESQIDAVLQNLVSKRESFSDKPQCGNFLDWTVDGKQSVTTLFSVSSEDTFTSVDTHTPCELKENPFIRTPDDSPCFSTTSGPPPSPPRPKWRKSRIPVRMTNFFKRPEKEEPKNKGIYCNTVAPLPQPGVAPEPTHRALPPPPKIPAQTKRTEDLKKGKSLGFKKSKSVKEAAPHIMKPKEVLKPLSNPVQSLALAFHQLNSGDWSDKLKGVKLIQALLQHHPSTLRVKLHEVCVTLVEEINNLRSSVACAVIDTLGCLYTNLQKEMDVHVERTGRALLLRIAQANANVFVQQQANLALEALVQNCNPRRVLTVLLNSGLSHMSAAVRASTGQQLRLLLHEMGADAVLGAGPSFTPGFLKAVSKISLDAAAEVRLHGHAVLQELCLHKDFRKQWQKNVEDKDYLTLQKVLLRAGRK